MTYPGTKKFKEAREDLQQRLKKNKKDSKRAEELWEIIKDLSYDDLGILSGMLVEHMSPIIKARREGLPKSMKKDESGVGSDHE